MRIRRRYNIGDLETGKKRIEYGNEMRKTLLVVNKREGGSKEKMNYIKINM